jgi:hypothetical protein
LVVPVKKQLDSCNRLAYRVVAIWHWGWEPGTAFPVLVSSNVVEWGGWMKRADR